MGKYSLNKGQDRKLNNMSSTHLFLELNELIGLLLVEEFDEEVVNSMIMH